jgi:glycosyltransferase involved in cell wall biosynthesis
MKVADLHVAQVSPREVSAGAEKVAHQLHRHYTARGVDSWLVVAEKQTDDSKVIELSNDSYRPAWTRALWRAAEGLPGSRGYHLLDRALRTVADPIRMLQIQRGIETISYPASARIPQLIPAPLDILHLHNLHGDYFDLRALSALNALVPTIYTLHDAWPLTGHCAYPMQCEKWRTGCGDCEYLDRYVGIRRDGSAQNARIKRKALTESGVRLAAPSRWLMNMAEESGIAGHCAETRVIPNGVDTTVFSPGDKTAARTQLGLPTDATIVLYTARSAKDNPYKGFETLEAALPLIAEQTRGAKLLLLAIGQDAPGYMMGDARVQFVPFVSDESTVAAYYRAADLYLHPSHAENHSLALLEATASGLPIVSSDAGGNPEIVDDGVTGLVFANRDAAELAEATVRLIRNPETRSRYAAAGVARARGQFTIEHQVNAYLDWYLEITASRQLG